MGKKIELTCPHCGAALFGADASMKGDSATCKKCQKEFEITQAILDDAACEFGQLKCTKCKTAYRPTLALGANCPSCGTKARIKYPSYVLIAVAFCLFGVAVTLYSYHYFGDLNFIACIALTVILIFREIWLRERYGMQIQCPNCRKKCRVSLALMGQPFKCGHCSTQFVVPGNAGGATEQGSNN